MIWIGIFLNGDISGGHCYMNSHAISEAKNHKYIASTKKNDDNTHNRSEM